MNVMAPSAKTPGINVGDFSFLPEVVLVKIFKYLQLEDRFRISLTCHTMNQIFNHPSVWQTASIHIMATQSLYTDCEPIIQRRFYSLIRKFGKYLKDLTLKVTGYPRNFPKEWNDVLYELASVCQLTSLHLDLGYITSFYHLRGKRPSDSDLLPIISLVKNSFRLKSFHIWSWPMFPAIFNNKGLNILQALIKNPKMKNIERFTLFGCNDEKWTERSPLLPSPNFTLFVIEYFENLTHLSLRSPMINVNIIRELSSPGRAKLKYFHIYVNYSSHNKDLRIPEILSRRWIKFHVYNPAVKVEVSILTRIPNSNLFQLLKPEIPTVAINLRKYSECNSELLQFIENSYSKQLQQFIVQCDSPNHDEELISLVERSKNLQVLVYKGKLYNGTIQYISRLPGHKWRRFELQQY